VPFSGSRDGGQIVVRAAAGTAAMAASANVACDALGLVALGLVGERGALSPIPSPPPPGLRNSHRSCDCELARAPTLARRYQAAPHTVSRASERPEARQRHGRGREGGVWGTYPNSPRY